MYVVYVDFENSEKNDIYIYTTSVHAKIRDGVNSGVKTVSVGTKLVLQCPRGGLSGTLSSLTHLYVVEIGQHKTYADK